jgi:hypothetical protein
MPPSCRKLTDSNGLARSDEFTAPNIPGSDEVETNAPNFRAYMGLYSVHRQK